MTQWLGPGPVQESQGEPWPVDRRMDHAAGIPVLFGWIEPDEQQERARQLARLATASEQRFP